MNQRPWTEAHSNFVDLQEMSVAEMLYAMNEEDQKVSLAVKLAIPRIIPFVEQLVEKIKKGGRLFYIGAGTSGRLGILDASECPPTFGVSDQLVIGLIAGGDGAIRIAVEFAEDSTTGAWNDLLTYHINAKDCVIGIAASGTTTYTVSGLKACQAAGITTACICSNPDSPLSHYSDYPIELELGPEFISGSTRLKSGTAQKLILNMISTSLMIRLGKVLGNKMVDMQLTNHKLVERGLRMVMEKYPVSEEEASRLLNKFGSVRAVLEILSENDPQKLLNP